MTFSRNHHGLFPDLVTHDTIWIDACQSLNIHADGHTDGRRTGIPKDNNPNNLNIWSHMYFYNCI